jgi:hypothetical protein
MPSVASNRTLQKRRILECWFCRTLDGKTFRVYADPANKPFCLTRPEQS